MATAVFEGVTYELGPHGNPIVTQEMIDKAHEELCVHLTPDHHRIVFTVAHSDYYHCVYCGGRVLRHGWRSYEQR